MISNVTNLVQTCMSNMSLSMASEKEVRKEVKHFLDKKQSQIQEISAQIGALKDDELPNEKEIKSQAVNIFTEMRNHEEFKQFGVNNYIKFVSEYLKMSDTDLDCILKLELTQQEKKPVFEQDEWDRDDIDKLLEEIKEKEAILEEMKENITQFKSQVISVLDTTKFEGISYIFRIFLSGGIRKNVNSNLELDLKQTKDLELVQLLQGYSLPYLDGLTIKRLPDDLGILREFIFECFPSSLKTFVLNSEGEKREIQDILDVLGIVSQKTSSELELHNFDLSISDFKRVLQLSKDSQEILSLNSCILKFDTAPKFKRIHNKSKLHSLYLDKGGLPENSDWKNYPKRLENICKGLSQYFSKGFIIHGLYSSGCGLEYQKVSEILDKYKLRSSELLYVPKQPYVVKPQFKRKKIN